MDLKKLAEPFSQDAIEWRVQTAFSQGDGKKSALVLAYVSNRAIQQRLDDVVGIENWRNEFQEWKSEAVLCGLSIKVGDEWITKYDGAQDTKIESIKGGLSDAMKRAAVQWGIGRYLYKLDSSFVVLHADKGDRTNRHYDSNEKKTYWWSAPALPEWAKVKKELPE